MKASSPASNDALRAGTGLLSSFTLPLPSVADKRWPGTLMIAELPCEDDRGRLLGMSGGGLFGGLFFKGFGGLYEGGGLDGDGGRFDGGLIRGQLGWLVLSVAIRSQRSLQRL